MGDETNIDGKYQVPPGNLEAEFVDEAQLVLINIRGIKDLEELQLAEEECLARAYEQLLSEVRVDTPLTTALIQHVHQSIFNDLYEWAGHWRTVQISKPGAIWPPPQFLDRAMKDFEEQVLTKFPASSLSDEAAFCEEVSEIQGEFLAVHPYREGNARTIKLLTNLLAAQTNRPLLAYDSSDAGSQNYIEAAKAALLTKGYDLLRAIVCEALQQAEQS